MRILLHLYIEKAIRDYYAEYLTETPHEQPWLVEFLSIGRIVEAEFLVKLEVKPFIGAHYSIGRDHITFRV